MIYVNAALNRLVSMRLYDTSRTVEVAEFIGLAALAVLVPLLLSGNQLLAGSAVNFMLIMAAINVRGWKKIIPLVALPSISAAAFGFLFGGLTGFLFLVPFICAGNLLILFMFKFLYVAKRNNYFAVLASAAVLKSGFLFIAALILVEFSVIPSAFLIAMGVTQLATAMIGGMLAFPVNAAYRRYFTG